MKGQLLPQPRAITLFCLALLAVSFTAILEPKSLALELTRATILAQRPAAREFRSDKLRISFSIPAHLRAALTTKWATAISILTPKEYEELARTSRGEGSSHGAEDEATVTIVKPLPLASQSALDNLYAKHNYLQREGYDIRNSRLGWQQAVSMKQEIKCCYGDPYVSEISAAVSPDRTFLVIVRGGRDTALFRQIVTSFRFL